MSEYLLDTTVMIDYLNGRKHVVSLVKNLALQGDILGCCSITVAEVYAGMRKDEENVTEELVDSLRYFETNREIAKLAGKFKSNFAQTGIALTITDALVATVAKNYNLILVTANKKDYPVPDLHIQEAPTRKET